MTQERLDAHTRQYHATLSAFAREISEWDTVRAESLERAEAWAASVVPGLDLVDRAEALVSELLEFEPPSDSARSSAEIAAVGEPSFGKQVDNVIASGSTTLIADLAFVARLEIRQMVRWLRRLAPEDSKWVFLEICQRVRRHLLRGLTALGRAMRTRLGGQVVDDCFVDELARSLACRRILAALWARVEQTDGQPIERRLRLAGTAIAMLQGHDAYSDLRLGDRRTLRDVHGRILAWVKSGGATPHAGKVLLQDLEGFVSLTRQINGRPELLEYDQFLGPKLLLEVGAVESDDIPAWCALMTRLRQLWGASVQLDRQLPLGANASRDAVRQALVDRFPPVALAQNQRPRGGGTIDLERVTGRGQ